MNDDLISRQVAIDKFEPWLNVKGYSEGERNMLKAVLYDLKFLPSAQQERKTGKWINDDDDWCYPECSVCGKNALEVQECGFKSNYCPHCGARMENSHEDD